MLAETMLQNVITRKNHCPTCGKFTGDDLCQCRIKAIVRCAQQAQQVQELMAQHQRDVMVRPVAEVACYV